MEKISVVIVTRNRSKELLHCLGSLASQSETLDELVVIDNDSNDTTKEIVLNFSKNVKFPVGYVLEKKTGYPVVYNRGLRESKCSWVAFIDDDCVAEERWFEAIKDSIKKYPGVSVILGQTDTYYNRNIISLSTSFLENLWKHNRVRNRKVYDLEILDNRNIVYNRRFLSKNKIAFDETRVSHYGGSSEDCDLGMQIQKVGGKAIYESNMKVFHKDPVNGIHYFKKLVYSTKGHLSYERKWSEYRKTIPKIHTKVQSAKHLLGFLKGSKINFISKIILIVVIGLTFLVVKLTKLYEKN